ncbi:MAG TPA: hypothetical protein VJ964_06105 [Balneolaceae bacterium]|nr:hypothetical protein [Balneolaceae bacterium]
MDTGEVGEGIVQTWAGQADLVANKVGNDKDGWDLLIAFPLEIKSNLQSLDFDDSPFRCLVQVKTTTTDKITDSIKLSNLKRLVESKLPSFYIIIQVTDDGIATNAYLYHVWEKIMGLVLNKFRNLDKPDWENLNNRHMQLPIGEAQKFEELHGRELRRLLQANIGESTTKYVEQKIELRKTIGYEGGIAKIDFEAELPEEYKGKPGEFFVDLTLGLVDEANLKRYSVYDIRFGEPVEVDTNKGGKLTVNTEPEEKLIISLSTIDNRIYTEIEAELYLPSSIAVNKENLKILYRAPYLNLLVVPGENQLKINCNLPDFNNECNLSEFRDFSEIVSFMNRVEGEKIKVKLQHKTRPTIDLFLESPISLNNEIATFAEIIQTALLLKGRFKVREDILFTPSNLYVQSNKLIFLGSLLRNEHVNFDLEMKGKPIIGKYPKIILVYPFNVFIGNSTYCLLIGIHGTPGVVNDQTEGELIEYELSTSNLKIENHRRLSNNNSNTSDAHSKLYLETKKKYSDKDTLVAYMSPDNEKNTRIYLDPDQV